MNEVLACLGRDGLEVDERHETPHARQSWLRQPSYVCGGRATASGKPALARGAPGVRTCQVSPEEHGVGI